MSQNKQPEDLSALEEYYRRQLLEYSRRAAIPTPTASPDPEIPAPVKPVEIPIEQPMSQPVKPPVSQKSAASSPTELMHTSGDGSQTSARSQPVLPTQRSSEPKAASVRQTSQPSSAKQPERGTDGEIRASFRRTDSSFPGTGVLPRTPKILRTASVVQPLPGSGDTGIGRIKARVTTGSGAVPIENAVVRIERIEGETVQLVDQLVTDGSGNTPVSQALPTAPASQSLSPGLDATPYAVYQVRIQAKGFAEYVAKNVLVFDGELSLVDADMLPKRENLQSNGEVRDA